MKMKSPAQRMASTSHIRSGNSNTWRNISFHTFCFMISELAIASVKKTYITVGFILMNSSLCRAIVRPPKTVISTPVTMRTGGILPRVILQYAIAASVVAMKMPVAQ